MTESLNTPVTTGSSAPPPPSGPKPPVPKSVPKAGAGKSIKELLLAKLVAEKEAISETPSGRPSEQAGGKTETELLREETGTVNTFLESKGYKFRVTGLEVLSQLKNDAGIGGSSRPMENLTPLYDKVPQLLDLGWLPTGAEGASPDLNKAKCDEYAAKTLEALLGIDDTLGDRAWPDKTPLRKRVTFDDCHKWELHTDGKPIYGESPAGLARRVVAALGSGRLAGIFPGEYASVSGEDLKSPERSRIMRKFGTEFAMALNAAGIEGLISAELAGSLLTQKELPDDIDINIRTTETDPKKAYVTNDLVRKFFETFDGAALDLDGKKVDVVAYGGIRNAASLAYQRTYGYEMVSAGETRVMRFDIEIKNVSGPAWSNHLKTGAEADPATAKRGPKDADAERESGEGKRSAKWLMLDNLKRTVSFRNEARQSVLDNPAADREKMIAEVLDQTREKQFWETFRGALDRCQVKEGMPEEQVRDWIRDQVKDEPSFMEAFDKSNRSKESFETWLVSVIRDPSSAVWKDNPAYVPPKQTTT